MDFKNSGKPIYQWLIAGGSVLLAVVVMLVVTLSTRNSKTPTSSTEEGTEATRIETQTETETPTESEETEEESETESETETETEPGEESSETEPATEATTSPTAAPQGSGVLTNPFTGATFTVPADIKRTNVYSSVATFYGGYYVKNPSQGNAIYLTFCMGYENNYSSPMVDMLASKGVRAVFFLTGGYFKSGNNPVGSAQKMMANGNLIGSHGYQHVHTTELSDEALVKDFKDMRDLVTQVLGNIPLRYYRPPYGSATERDLYIAQKLGYIPVMFSFSYEDYDLNNQPSTAVAYQKLVSALRPGAIYYLHVTPCNLQALPDFIDYARSQGYTFLRLDEELSPQTPPETEPETPSETEPETPPETEPSETEPPETEPSETEPPETEPSETDPPETDPPATDPPETDPPETDPVTPPETDPPETDPPATDPPETDPPETEPSNPAEDPGDSTGEP